MATPAWGGRDDHQWDAILQSLNFHFDQRAKDDMLDGLLKDLKNPLHGKFQVGPLYVSFTGTPTGQVGWSFQASLAGTVSTGMGSGIQGKFVLTYGPPASPSNGAAIIGGGGGGGYPGSSFYPGDNRDYFNERFDGNVNHFP